MPYSFQTNKILLPKETDRRIKLSDEDKENIIRLYKKEKEPIREIARIYENICSRRMIQFVIFPERLKQARANRDWKKYYTKEKNTATQKEHRQYKARILKVKPRKLNIK